MTTNTIVQNAQNIAAKTGKRTVAFIRDEARKAVDFSNIRIDGDQIKGALARAANLLRPDVPRAAFTKEGKRVPVPADLKDEFNPMYKDATGVLMASKLLLDDVADKPNTTPSPAAPLIALREVWPILATVPFMPLAGLHWSCSVAILGSYAFLAKTDNRSSFLGNLKYIALGRSWKEAVILGPLFAYLIFAAPGALASGVLPLWMCWKAFAWLKNRNYQVDPKGRAKKLYGITQHLTRPGYATETDHEDKMHTVARQEQVNAVVADKAPLVDIGATATGFYTGRGSLNSPDEGKNMVLSGTDLGPGMLVLGSSGTGKTYTVLIPFLKEISRINKVAKAPEERHGMLVMDNKGELPLIGCGIYEDYLLLSPEPVWDPANQRLVPATPFNPIEGLNAEQAVKLLGDIHEAETGSVWDMATMEKHLYTAIALECAKMLNIRSCPVISKEGVYQNRSVKVAWTLGRIEAYTKSDEDRQTIVYTLASIDSRAKEKNKPSPVAQHPLMEKAFKYFQENYNKLADNTKSSVNFTVSAWSMKTLNRYMGAWWETETGVSIEDVFKGKAIGLYCPKSRYGLAGQLIESMVRQRLYNHLLSRGKGWEKGGTRAMFVWDEFALGIGKGEMEANIAPIQRSLGMSSIFATQTITEAVARMGRERADAFLDNVGKNIICLASNEETYEFLSKKMGTYRGFTPSSRSKEAPVAIDFYGTLRAKDLAGIDGVEIYDQERLENKQTKAPKSMFTHGMLPNFEAMRGMKDADKLYKNVRDEDAFIRYPDAGLLSMEEKRVFEASELARLLKFRFHAFCMVHRGGAPRFDVVHLGPKAVPATN